MTVHKQYLEALKLISQGGWWFCFTDEQLHCGNDDSSRISTMTHDEMIHWNWIGVDDNGNLELTAAGDAILTHAERESTRYERMESTSHLGDLIEDHRIDTIKYQDWWDAWQKSGALSGLSSASPVFRRGEIIQHVAKLVQKANQLGLEGRELDSESPIHALWEIEKELEDG